MNNQNSYQPFMQVDARENYNQNRNAHQSGGQFGADLNPLIQKKSSKHIRTLIGTLILFIGEVTVLALYFAQIIDVQIGALIAICVAIYVLYLMLSLCCNPLLSYLGNIEHGMDFENQYDRIRNILGHFDFHVQCYHYETRYHTKTTTDSNGNTRHQTYTTTEKVITHTANQTLTPRACIDQSGNVQKIQALTQIVFMHNRVNYNFSDDRSASYFNMEWQRFQNMHRRDAHQDYTQKFVLPGFKPKMTFYIGESPANMRCRLVLFTLLGFSWPYSMQIESKVSRYDLEFMKMISF